MMSDLVLIDDNFDVELDLKYALSSNVTNEAFYKEALCYLHKDAVLCLNKAITLARIQGYKLKIFDGFRPLRAQQFLFDKFPGGDFVSDPETGSIPHCRGIAVDLTLIDESDNELDMGTQFDNFTTKAYHGSVEVSKEAQENRFILMGIMLSSGFDFYQKEWWHYQLFNPRSYNVIKDFDI